MDWDDEDDWEDDPAKQAEWIHSIIQYHRPVAFSAVHGKNFDTGETNPGKIFPVDHGPDCKGHEIRDAWYSEYYKWTYVRVPPPPFQDEPNVVWAKEEYL